MTTAFENNVTSGFKTSLDNRHSYNLGPLAFALSRDISDLMSPSSRLTIRIRVLVCATDALRLIKKSMRLLFLRLLQSLLDRKHSSKPSTTNVAFGIICTIDSNRFQISVRDAKPISLARNLSRAWSKAISWQLMACQTQDRIMARGSRLVLSSDEQKKYATGASGAPFRNLIICAQSTDFPCPAGP